MPRRHSIKSLQSRAGENKRCDDWHDYPNQTRRKKAATKEDNTEWQRKFLEQDQVEQDTLPGRQRNGKPSAR